MNDVATMKRMILSASELWRDGMTQTHMSVSDFAKANPDATLKMVESHYKDIVEHLDAVVSILKTSTD